MLRWFDAESGVRGNADRSGHGQVAAILAGTRAADGAAFPRTPVEAQGCRRIAVLPSVDIAVRELFKEKKTMVKVRCFF